MQTDENGNVIPVNEPVNDQYVDTPPVSAPVVNEESVDKLSFESIMREQEIQNAIAEIQKKNKVGMGKIILIVIVTCILSSLLTILVIMKVPSLTKKNVTTVTKQDVSITETGIASSVSKVYDSVVIVKSYRYGSLYGTGTGFVYKKGDNSYFLLTNYHVIKEATNVKIVLTTGDEYDVKVLGGDQYADVLGQLLEVFYLVRIEE